MNEEIIKNYERDLRLFCSLAANNQIDRQKYIGDISERIYMASSHAFKLAANQMYFRLEGIDPKQYPFQGLVMRNFKINSFVDKIIKEKTDHEQKTQPLS